MPLKATDYGVVLVTAGNQAEAEAIARHLVTEKLAACVGLHQIASVYTWEGQICAEPEWQLTIKTRCSLCDRLIARIQELHSYSVPEIIALPIVAGSVAYLAWIDQQLEET